MKVNLNYIVRLCLKNKQEKEGRERGRKEREKEKEGRRERGRERQAGTILDSSIHWIYGQGDIRLTGLHYPVSERLLLHKRVGLKPRGSFGSPS